MVGVSVCTESPYTEREGRSVQERREKSRG